MPEIEDMNNNKLALNYFQQACNNLTTTNHIISTHIQIIETLEAVYMTESQFNKSNVLLKHQFY